MTHTDIKIRVFKVSDFISWQRNKTLNINPNFQRRSVWPPGAKSYLIDTIVRGLPIPIIFIREQKTSLQSLEPLREVVDGQQRLRTLFSYIGRNLLSDYNEERDSFKIRSNHNKLLAGKSFEDLTENTRQKILDYEFSVHILPSQIDDREILQIFARMNSTGYKLNNQELRNAKWFGEFKTLMYELGSEQLPRWRSWNIFTEQDIARMLEVELTSELATLILKGLTARTQNNLDKIYKEKDETFVESNEVKRRFNLIIDLIDTKFADYIPNSPFINKALFHILFGIIYNITFGMNSSLRTKIKSKNLNPKFITKLKKLGARIENKELPEKELEIITARQKNKEYINSLYNFFKKELTIA